MIDEPTEESTRLPKRRITQSLPTAQVNDRKWFKFRNKFRASLQEYYRGWIWPSVFYVI